MHLFKKLTASLVCACSMLLLAGTASSVDAAGKEVSLTAVTYNIAGVRYTGADKIARQIASVQPDLAAIQELKHYGGDQVQQIIGSAGLPYCYFTKTYNHKEGIGGEAIYASSEILEEDTQPFVIDGGNSQMYQRVVIEKEGKKIAFYQTHLTWLSTAKRRKQLEILMDTVSADPTPYKIVAGDFNLTSKAELIPIMRELNPVNGKDGVWHETFWDKENYEGWDFYAIDNILVSRNIRIDEVKVFNQEKISDHYGLAARLTLLERSERSTAWLDNMLEESNAQLKLEEDYTADSLETLRAAVQASEKVLAQENPAPQSALDNQGKRLYKALTSLVRLPAWRQDENGWKYRKNGEFIKDQWLLEDGKRYCFDADGYARQGLYKEDGKLYYFRSDLSLAVDTWIRNGDDLYLANYAGVILTGWNFKDTGWYYMDEDGSVHKGWLTQDGLSYYFLPDGTMAVGSHRIDGKMYYFNDRGVWQEDVQAVEDPIIDRPADGNGNLPGAGKVTGMETHVDAPYAAVSGAEVIVTMPEFGYIQE